MPGRNRSGVTKLWTSALFRMRRHGLLSSTGLSDADSDTQTASPLFRLPTELRRLIWEQCIGGPTVHIHYNGMRLSGVECVVADESDFSLDSHEQCWKAQRRTSRLSTVLICKRVYFECIHMLYSMPLFDFTMSPMGITVLPQRVPAAHVARITKANLTWEWLGLPPNLVSRKPSESARRWTAIWENLAAMQGLEFLRVELIITPTDAHHWTGQEQHILDYVKKVTRPTRFELILPFPTTTG